LQVAEGSVPCSLVAMHILITCSDMSKKTGDASAFLRLIMSLVACAISMTCLGPLIRAIDGQPAWGTHPVEKLFYACKTLPEFFFGFVLLAFPGNACFWLYRQLLMSQRLLDLIEPPRVVDVRWRSQKHTKNDTRAAGGPSLPRLDLSNPKNVQGWAALRRVVYGRNFAPAVELKMQCYVTVTLFLFLVSSAANTLGSVSGSQSESLPADFVIVSVLRPTFLSIPIILQIFLAYKINRYAYSYAEALNAQSLKCTAAAASLPNVEGHWEECERPLRDAAGMLAAAAAEIESEAESRPMRVLFIKAEPAAASMIISIIMSIVALQIYGMRSLV